MAESLQISPQAKRLNLTAEDLIAGAAPGRRLPWAGAGLLALLLLLAQLVWFNRDPILRAHPAWLPYVQQLCERLNCSVTRRHNARAIRLIDRDVRRHPRYTGALLAQATMLNELSVPQPWPRVQLTLFDTAGALLGYRNFAPADYLAGGLDPAPGMPVDTPVAFEFALSGPSAAVVSFEFRLW